MNKKIIAGGALTGLVLSGALMGAVSAQTAATATGLTEEQAIEIALLEVPGDVTEVELENEDGTMIYEIEIMKADGQEFEVEIAADTGAVIEVEAEDEDDRDDDESDDD